MYYVQYYDYNHSTTNTHTTPTQHTLEQEMSTFAPLGKLFSMYSFKARQGIVGRPQKRGKLDEDLDPTGSLAAICVANLAALKESQDFISAVW